MTKSRFAAAVRFFSVSTSARDSSRVMLAFARRKYAEIEYGYPIVVTPGVASARSSPLSFTTMPIISGRSAPSGREALSFAIRHLLHMLRRNKTHSINVLESGKDELAKILGLVIGWDEIRQPLPCITGALNKSS